MPIIADKTWRHWHFRHEDARQTLFAMFCITRVHLRLSASNYFLAHPAHTGIDETMQFK
jgi:hypothetical protein